jgi:hypothetical protein
MTEALPPATLSLDLDNQWAYMRVHGDAGWESYPSYLDRVMPRILKVLQRRNLRITVFVVGQDAVLEKNHAALAQIAAAGHEIANHSFAHRPSLAQWPEAEITSELDRAEEAIERATARRCRGFRGPGFSISKTLLGVLQRRGYTYDASTFPTFVGPLARAYYQSSVKNVSSSGDERQNLYGGWREGLRPLHPYQWQLKEGTLLEIPVTTFPLLRTPIHLTYLLYLSGLSRRIAREYFRAALRLCRLTGAAPSLLLHPLDFLGKDDVPELNFFPGMNAAGEEKTQFVSEVLDLFCGRFAVTALEQYSTTVTQAKRPLAVRRF